MPPSEAIVKQLVKHGIDTVFGIPGTQTLPLNEAIADRDDVRYVVARHETAVPHEAWGYTETSGRMAATLVIPGPGDMNAMNGLKSALNDCVPILHLSVETNPELRGGDAIHETPPDTYDNVVKENIHVKNPEEAAAAVGRGIAAARTPPKGPVRVAIPRSFLAADTTIAEPGTYDIRTMNGVPEEAIERGADHLAAAESPFIIGGGGIRAADAASELRRVAERLEAPVAMTYKGKGNFPEDHELFAGTVCSGISQDVVDAIEASDVVLGVGTDFDALTFRGWSIPMADNLVHITLNESDIGTAYDPTVGIVADAAKALTAIDQALGWRTIESTGGRARAESARRGTTERIRDLLDVSEPPLPTVRVLKEIRESLPRETVVTADAGGSRVWLSVVFEVYEPRSFMMPGSWGTMGSGLPSAIGAKLANPDQDVVTITGDGGLMMCVHELHTTVSEEIPIVVVVLNNHDYAIISEQAEFDYEIGRSAYDWSQAPIDFTALAESMGMASIAADTPEEIRGAISIALASDEPILVEIATDPLEPQASTQLQESDL